VSGDRKPHFRFNPNAYNANRVFEQSQVICDVCARECVWKYTGSIYSPSKPTVCASCIANGRLERFLGAENYSFHDTEAEGAEQDALGELLLRTPGVTCFNPFDWPVLNGIPMAFILYGDEESDMWKDPKVRAEVNKEYGNWPWDGNKPGSYVLLFKQVGGDEYRVVIDPD
jgi:uncharacterized protein CbrC (UPF0167 family)